MHIVYIDAYHNRDTFSFLYMGARARKRNLGHIGLYLEA